MTLHDRYETLLAPLDLPDLTARSVIGSALLGTGPFGMRVAVLLRLTSLFGIADGTARVALSRMTASGEVEQTSQGTYRPAGRILERRNRQDASRWPRTMSWDGSWVMAAARSEHRRPTELEALRTSARTLRLAEGQPGLFLRPDNLVPGQFVAAHELIAARCDVFRSFPLGAGEELAGRLWPLAQWAERSRHLGEVMAVISEDLSDGRPEALAPGFVVSAAVFRHVLADPLLPPPLLPGAWPGDALREEFERHDTAWQHLLKDWVRREPAPL